MQSGKVFDRFMAAVVAVGRLILRRFRTTMWVSGAAGGDGNRTTDAPMLQKVWATFAVERREAVMQLARSKLDPPPPPPRAQG